MNIIIITAAFLIGGLVSAQILKNRKLFDFEKKKQEAEKIINEGKREAENIILTAKKQTTTTKQNIQSDTDRRNNRINKTNEILKNKEEQIRRKEEKNNEVKLKAASLQEEVSTFEQNIKKTERKTREKLIEKTDQNPEKVKEEILAKSNADLEQELQERLSLLEEDLKENAVKISKRTISQIMQRLCSATSVETRAVLIKVKHDQVKGKIVGRQGGNVHIIESELDVDVIFNDLPNTISVSAFNLVNRRIAQKVIEKLVQVRGDINAELIKKAIKQSQKDTEEELYVIGKKVVEKLGFKNWDKELITIIGRLQYRTSYGQNIMKHSLEVAYIASMLASEIGLNEKTCKIGAFLHDLGKAIDQNPDVQGTHDVLTKELMEKFGFSEEEVHAAWTHHDAEPQKTPEALIVKAADAISASRPGARQESVVRYGERIQALEETGKSYTGVKKAFAISGGRELRLLIDPEAMDDAGMRVLAGKIARQIEEEIVYPGKIKINAIRRTDHMETAR